MRRTLGLGLVAGAFLLGTFAGAAFGGSVGPIYLYPGEQVTVIAVAAPTPTPPAPPEQLSVSVSCLQPNGSFTVMFTGSVIDGSFDYSPTSSFATFETAQLEGTQGALAFNAAQYPEGVYVRWTDWPSITNMAEVPAPCVTTRRWR